MIHAFVKPSTRKVRAALFCASILSAGYALPAVAQTTPPLHVDVDENGVDLVSGNYVTSLTEGAIGSGEGKVAFTRTRGNSGGWFDDWTGGLAFRTSGGVTIAYVIRGPAADAFSVSGSTYTSIQGSGATLVATGTGYTYTAADGTKTEFTSRGVGKLSGGYPVQGYACSAYGDLSCSIPTSITKPNGMKFTINYTWVQKCTSGAGPTCTAGISFYRLASVTSSAGYGFNVSYQTDSPGNFSAPQSSWYYRASVAFSNANQAPASPPTITYLNPAQSFGDFTDPAGRTWHFTGSGILTGIQRPGAASNSTSISYDSSAGYVSSITIDGVTTNYSRTVSGSTATTTVTDAQSHQKIVEADLSIARVTKITQVLSPANQVTSFAYDANGRLNTVTYPEGNKTVYAYDGRGNITSTTLKAKTTVGGTDIVTSAGYDTTCSNIVTCNSPNWTRDENLNQTDYAYDTTTGQVTSVTLPAATSGGVRPQTRYGYTATAGVSMPTSMSACRTGSSCAGTSDEVKTTVGYNSNLLPTSVSKGAGDASLTATQTMTYDSSGNVLSVDGPLAGSSDTITYRYDAANNRVGIISADPDGAGAQPRRAQKTTYNSDDQPTAVEFGTVAGVSDGDWAAFSSREQLANTYDANAKLTKQVLSGGGTPYQVAQYSYDTLGRLDCTALRMNSATWGSLPAACTAATTGSDGPDRIKRTSYDALGRQSKVQTAYGTADQADDVTTTYSANGKVASVTDAEGGKTSYDYDGFDRLTRTSYPVTTQGAATSSGSDYEQLGYDAASNVTSRRLRDGQTINYGYDNLNRVTSKTTPGSAYLDWDVAYGYDLLGQMTSAVGDGAVGNNFAYDALGRLVTEGNYGATTYHAYDLAGRQTRLTWSDGFYVDYDYGVTGQVLAIRENGATSGAGVLASYSYDDLGRRIGITRGNGTTTSYSYDGVSRLASLTQDLGSGSYDLTHGFGYNPSNQITSLTRSNDAYAWTGDYNVDRPYAVNGLNQMTAAGGALLGYDGRGNLTSSDSDGYTYTVENRLATGPGYSLAYEPGGGQLMQIRNDTTNEYKRFAYSGDQMIAELGYNGSAWSIAKRFVPGAGMDEPVVWYEGSGTSDRRWLHDDERGSVVAVSDVSGNIVGVNSYNEYGIPASGNIGRFQYTGQVWLPELGLAYYKARMYSPTLGRFMQTDPIGYDAGLNWYNYVGSDPINFTDPFGLDPAPDDGPPIIGTVAPCALGTVRRVQNEGKEDQHYYCVATNARSPRTIVGSTGGPGGGGRAKPRQFGPPGLFFPDPGSKLANGKTYAQCAGEGFQGFKEGGIEGAVVGGATLGLTGALLGGPGGAIGGLLLGGGIAGTVGAAWGGIKGFAKCTGYWKT